MNTQLYASPIFGPIHSRRLGISLGINLLPADGKCCSFDCLYCECGLNSERVAHSKMPTADEVSATLRQHLAKLALEGIQPDVLTFAGNGEPTLHPQFPEIVNRVIEIRNEMAPQAKVSVLTNATQTVRPEIFNALTHVDNNIVKLDTVDPIYINKVDRPVSHSYDVNEIIRAMKQFGRRCIIHTMFMQGTYNGEDLDNTTDRYVLPWLDTVQQIQPREVMIYTIDRNTPVATLQKATHQQLDRIAAMVEARGVKCQTSY